jgi:hypothetical protein
MRRVRRIRDECVVAVVGPPLLDNGNEIKERADA